MNVCEPVSCACAERIEEDAKGPDTSAVILAAGAGLRFSDPRGKQFVELCGMPVLAWSLLAFDALSCVSSITLVVPEKRIDEVGESVLAGLALRHKPVLVAGGATRQDSVLAGLAHTSEDVPLVAIHDGARPLVEPAAIERCLDALRRDAGIDGALLAVPATDTLKVCDSRGLVTSTLDRSCIFCAQTPQCFRREAILEAHERALFDGFQATDDASLLEWCGRRVRVVDGSADNIKITVRSDLAVAEALLAARIGLA